MSKVVKFLTATQGSANGSRIGAQDVVAYGYLLLGILIILVPVLWTVLSSFKSEEAIENFDTRLMPFDQIERNIDGVGVKRLYLWKDENGVPQEVFKAGPTRKLTDTAKAEDPTTIFQVPRKELLPAEEIRLATENYLDPLLSRGGQKFFNFKLLLWNTVFVTVVATVITLLINSMAAFALSKYQFKGRLTFTILIVATLLIPNTIILVSLFFVVWSFGIFGSLWGVIIPAAATPTGVFLLRQYMLTIPDELLEAARMDAASEWRIYWRIILPLSLPALSVLAILSTIWRWNDFLWPLIVLISDPSQHTIQLGLTSFSGEFDQDHHFILAMTVVSLIPVTLVFVWLQRFITTGIATTGLK
ncbi:MAG: carbohydrate ABC transporter permease [Gammaproteobacteria bacterium]|nr:carbohydrate ABC transporter permease [Gammaproteobacteria bacterium]